MKTKLLIMFIALFAFAVNNGARAQVYHYDVNNDGEVDITDVILVVNYILGKDNESQNTHEAIDLGLPSGTEWASCNVGALRPEKYGGYYAWGETEEKEHFTFENYIHCDGSYANCHDLGSDISGTEYDVAHVKWGGNWCMPTIDDFKELLENCTFMWTTLNGVTGGRFTSNINGNSIFLPATGYGDYDGITLTGINGYYLSSTQDPNRSDGTSGLYFFSHTAYWNYFHRQYGYNIRPVLKKSASLPT